jgi:hypothetical protein
MRGGGHGGDPKGLFIVLGVAYVCGVAWFVKSRWGNSPMMSGLWLFGPFFALALLIGLFK